MGPRRRGRVCVARDAGLRRREREFASPRVRPRRVDCTPQGTYVYIEACRASVCLGAGWKSTDDDVVSTIFLLYSVSSYAIRKAFVEISEV